MKVLALLLLSLFWPEAAHTSLSPKIKVFRGQQQEPKIRVRIAESLPKVTLAGTDLERTFHPSKQEQRLSGRKRVQFKCSLLGEKKLAKEILLASVKSPTGLVTFGEKKYHGSIHIVADGNESSCDVVNEVRLEQYISGLLSKEMNREWPIEALKAQAVAARTYALSKMRKKKPNLFANISQQAGFYDLENSEKHQVSGTFFDSTVKTDMATTHTRGEVLVSNKGKMTPIFFHASCGGKTRLPQHVWANPVSSYASVNCQYCRKERGKSWSGKLSLKRMKSFLKWAHKRGRIQGIQDFSLSKNIRLVSNSAENPRLSLYIGKDRGILNKQSFRNFFGRMLFPSTYFSLKFKKGFWEIHGQGNGHGVGMCQVGVRSLAMKGLDYREILEHYFPGHQLTQFY